LSPTRRTADEEGFPSAFSASPRETTQWLLCSLASWCEGCGTQTFHTPRRRARRAKRIHVHCLPRRACREIAYSFASSRLRVRLQCTGTSGVCRPAGTGDPYGRGSHGSRRGLLSFGPPGLKRPATRFGATVELRRSPRPCVKQRPVTFASSRLRVRFQRAGTSRVYRSAGAADPSGRGTHG
jgi:hypothetical protein